MIFCHCWQISRRFVIAKAAFNVECLEIFCNVRHKIDMASIVSFVFGFIVGAIVLFLVFQYRVGSLPAGKKHFLAVHHYKNEESLDAMKEYEKEHMDEIKKALKSADATCKFMIRSDDKLIEYCYWVAKDSESIRTQLRSLSHFWSHTTIEEVDHVHFF